MEIQISVKKSHLYGFLSCLIVILGAFMVSAFGGSNPSVLGHSAAELIVNGTSVVDNSLTGADIDESTLGTVPSATSATSANSANSANTANTASVALNANACSNDGTCEGGVFSGSTFVSNTITFQDGGGGGGTADIDKAGTSLELETDVGGNVGINTRLLIGAVGGASEVLDVFGNGRFTGSITVASCTGCSTIAEMMEVQGVGEGDVVCIDQNSGVLKKCDEDSSLLVQGIATTHAEQVLNRACGGEENTMVLGGNESSWMHRTSCTGWYPVAIEGIHEFTKVHCSRSDGSALQFGDRLVTASDGMLRPIAKREQGGDAVIATARTICRQGVSVDQIHALLR